MPLLRSAIRRLNHRVAQTEILDNGVANPDGKTGCTAQEVAIRQHVMLWGALSLMLAGCGSSEPGRTSGGMATGAGTGALIGLIGGPIGVVVGAAVGAGAGALTATNTAPSAVNLGDPLWANSPGAPGGPSGGGPLPPSPADGGMAPPQPLQSAAAYGAPPQSAPPSPGASPMPLTAPIQSQPLPPAQ